MSKIRYYLSVPFLAVAGLFVTAALLISGDDKIEYELERD